MKTERSLPSRKNRSAFSLIELLVVIAVIGILAAILIPAVGAVKKKSSQSIITSNLRQIGSVITLYTQDHNNTLPGPLYSKQKPRYKEVIVNEDGVRTKDITSMLTAYCNLPLDGSKWRDFPLLSSPIFEDIRPANATYSYLMQQQSSDTDTTNPWGHDSTDTPFTVYQLAAKVDNTQWAMQALDSGNLPSGINSSNVLAEPLFNNERATLYFDWHVEFVAID